MKAWTLSSSTNCWAVWAVTAMSYWLSWTMISSGWPLTPPAALISSTASVRAVGGGHVEGRLVARQGEAAADL